MGRKFIVERGQKISRDDQQPHHDRHTPNVRYTIHDAVEIFIEAKEAEGIRHSTIKGYYETVRYFKDWLSNDIEYFIRKEKFVNIRVYIV